MLGLMLYFLSIGGGVVAALPIISLYALAGEGEEQFNSSFITRVSKQPSGWLFGNEARGLPTLPPELIKVAIPMKGFAESLNVASAAAIVLHSVGLSL
ncbi:MAG: hypothetical protein RL059_1296 [Bacteroidota bacterium]